MEQDTEKTIVIYRRWRTGPYKDVIALFPEIEARRGMCMSYMHVGQHGAADYAGVVARTFPALVDADDVHELHRELTGRGYNLDVRRRRPNHR